jgi:hypothetical protein
MHRCMWGGRSVARFLEHFLSPLSFSRLLAALHPKHCTDTIHRLIHSKIAIQDRSSSHLPVRGIAAIGVFCHAGSVGDQEY